MYLGGESMETRYKTYSTKEVLSILSRVLMFTAMTESSEQYIKRLMNEIQSNKKVVVSGKTREKEQ